MRFLKKIQKIGHGTHSPGGNVKSGKMMDGIVVRGIVKNGVMIHGMIQHGTTHGRNMRHQVHQVQLVVEIRGR